MELRKSGIIQSSSGSKYVVEHFVIANNNGKAMVLNTTNERGKSTFILGYASRSATFINGLEQIDSWNSTDYYFCLKETVYSYSTNSYNNKELEENKAAEIYTIEGKKITINVTASSNYSKRNSCDVYVIDEL